MAHVFEDPCNLNSDFEICDGSDTIIRWEHWRKLAELVDDLAVYLKTPGYTSVIQLIEQLGAQPFTEPKLPQVSGVLEFVLEPGTEVGEGPNIPNSSACPTVTNRAILTAFNGIPVNMFSLPSGTPMPGQGAYQFYSEYAADGKLFFVNEEDDCWCKTIFKIDPADSALTFVATSDPKFGCCQTLDPVPKIGDRLDYSQDFIPASYTCQWGDVDGIDLGSAEELLARGNGTIYCPKCWNNTVSQAAGCQTTPSEDMVQYKFDPFDPFNPEAPRYLRSVARPIKGYLTWPILKEHLDLIIDRLEFILQCNKHDGLRPSCLSHSPATATGTNGYETSAPTLWHYDAAYQTDGGVVDDAGWHLWGYGCGASKLSAWLASLRHEFALGKAGGSTLNPNVPGTLVEPLSGTAEYISQCSGSFKEPWNELAGGAQNCDAAGIRVYCDTINQLANLIITIGQRLWPFDTFDNVDDTCPDSYISCCMSGNICQSMLASKCLASGGKEIDDCSRCCSGSIDCTNVRNPHCCETEDREVFNCQKNETTGCCECPDNCDDGGEFYCCCNNALEYLPEDAQTCDECCIGPITDTGGSTREQYCASFGCVAGSSCEFVPESQNPSNFVWYDCITAEAQDLDCCDAKIPCPGLECYGLNETACALNPNCAPSKQPCVWSDTCVGGLECVGIEDAGVCIATEYYVGCAPGFYGCALCPIYGPTIACGGFEDSPCPSPCEKITNSTPFCGECGTQRSPTCCLKHEAFEHESMVEDPDNPNGPLKTVKSLNYFDEIVTFVKRATNNYFTECRYNQNNCKEIICGAACNDYLDGSMSTCLDQGGIEWHLESAAYDSNTPSNFYVLRITAPSSGSSGSSESFAPAP